MPGEKLPTEVYFARKFNVSRITSKRALDVLEHLGLIYRKQGSGSFAADKISCKHLNTVNEPASSQSNTISFILPYDKLNGGFIDIVQSATAVFEEKGFHLTLHNKGANSQNDRELLMFAKKTAQSELSFIPEMILLILI